MLPLFLISDDKVTFSLFIYFSFICLYATNIYIFIDMAIEKSEIRNQFNCNLYIYFLDFL